MVPKLFVFSKIFGFRIFTACFVNRKMPVYCIKKKNICFFSVNTKYISSRELKTSKFSLVLRTRENSDIFNSLDEIYFVFTSNNQISSIYLNILFSTHSLKYIWYSPKKKKKQILLYTKSSSSSTVKIYADVSLISVRFDISEISYQ